MPEQQNEPELLSILKRVAGFLDQTVNDETAREEIYEMVREMYQDFYGKNKENGVYGNSKKFHDFMIQSKVMIPLLSLLMSILGILIGTGLGKLIYGG